uniref:Transmembrane protein 68 n=1 Tax=Moschus moschiferus TaxID=68415 RepID=A0A8C6FRD4_MOSMO
MTNKNQSCGVGQDSMPSMTCLIHVLEAWFGVEHLEDYWNFANYLLWVFTPLLLLILPYFTIFLLYLTIIFLHIYKRKNVLKEAYSHNLWDGARKTVATLWDGHAAVWHGYEVHGMEKIPEEGPALIIFYHGAIPIDFYYFMAKIFIQKGRTCRVVADHFVFKIPGLFRWLYEKFRYPFAPMYGGFPVKLRTYLGDPIPYDPKITAEELAEKTKDAVQALIDKHQRIPGNIMSALLERFRNKQKINQKTL